MAFTPVVRWKNFTLQNFKSILEIYPDLSNKVTRSNANELIENNLPGYKRTAYQFACQLGLEDRSVDHLRIQNYLFTFSDDNLAKYLEFWLKTYYAPNPFVNGQETPVMIYLELGKRILASPQLQQNFEVFFQQIQGGNSFDILKNALVAHGAPIKLREISNQPYFYIDHGDRNKLEQIISKLESDFPIPSNHKDRGLFFERFSFSNFCKFYDIPQTIIKEQTPEYSTAPLEIKNTVDKDFNRILVGAPGTGKSYRLRVESAGLPGSPGAFEQQNIERVTFYPNYSYSQFVGTYKPKPSRINTTEPLANPNSDSSPYITYEFVPGPFLRLLARALLDYEQNAGTSKNYLLIVEEINRANPAAVFGDIFQLLDRDALGRSEYKISCSEDIREYLIQVGLSDVDRLYLPPNFYIWATMNSADQGVQPMDTAFKRRWQFEYMDIDANQEEIADYEVTIKGYGVCKWNDFRKCLNLRLIDLEVKEDKLIGPFFIPKEDLNDQNDSTQESRFQKAFKYKLLMYLAEDVFKHNKKSLFGDKRSFSQIIASYDQAIDKIFYGLDESFLSLGSESDENIADDELVAET